MTDFLMKTKEYIQSNKDWLFSGIGVLIISTIFAGFLVLFKRVFKKNRQEISNIETITTHFLKKEEVSVYTPRSEFDDYITFVVNQAKKNVSLVSITFGFVSYPKLEKLIEEQNIVFDFYILDPESQYFKERTQDINGDLDNDYLFSKDIENLVKLKQKFINKVNIYKYDNYPFWHYILVDEYKLFISHHPINSLGYNTCSVLELNKKISSNIFKLFFDYIELIKKESKRI